MKFNSVKILKSALGHFFRSNVYSESVALLRKAIRDDKYYKENWNGVIQKIVKNELMDGEPLSLIYDDANLPLDEDSDEEAYKWLTLMLINVAGEPDSPIIDDNNLYDPPASKA